MSDNDIGKKIYQRRKALNLTLEQVGNAVGVGKSTIQRWENGQIKNMGRDKIAALARVLRMDPVEFVSVSDEIKQLPRIAIRQPKSKLAYAYIKAVVKNPLDEKKAKRIEIVPKIIDPKLESLVKQWEVATPKAKEEAVRYLEYLNTVKE